MGLELEHGTLSKPAGSKRVRRSAMSLNSASARLIREANSNSDHNIKLLRDADAVADELCRNAARLIRRKNKGKLTPPRESKPPGPTTWTLSGYWDLMPIDEHLILRFVAPGPRAIVEHYGHGLCRSRDAATYLGLELLVAPGLAQWLGDQLCALRELNNNLK